MNLRRVLILADESADWIVAGVRQLDRLALAIDEFAVENGETSPVVVCIFWRSDLDQSQRWIPADPRLTHVAFRNELDAEPYDLVLSTRLFLYRKAVWPLLEQPVQPVSPQPPSWENYFAMAKGRDEPRAGAWEYIANGDEI